MLSKKIEEALNDQVSKEAYASSYYLAMASWCEINGLRGCASFLYEQSDEEKEHMMKLFRYVNAAGGHARVPALKEPPYNYKSLKDVFETALDQELSVTKSINELVELCFKSQDYSSFNFLQWYVAEQHEEENIFTTILNVFKIAGNDAKSLLLVDQEVERIRGQEAKAE